MYHGGALDGDQSVHKITNYAAGNGIQQPPTGFTHAGLFNQGPAPDPSSAMDLAFNENGDNNDSCSPHLSGPSSNWSRGIVDQYGPYTRG